MASAVVYTNFGGQLVHENRNGVERTYVHDENGNTTYLVDSSGVTDSYTYTPYGQVASHGGTSPTPFTFAGAVGYYAAGLSFFTSYVRARWYSNVSGNWGSVDPLWPGQKPYAYVDGNPAMHTDPSGMISTVSTLLLLYNRANCESKFQDVIIALVNSGNPWLCGIVRRCIGQYLDPSNKSQCGQHGGGHGFSGFVLAGCCIQVDIDLCVIFSQRNNVSGLPAIPFCLDRLIREIYGGKNPLSDCVSVSSRPGYEYCPPGYAWINDPMLGGYCAAITYVLPQ
jgi:RHS repeat-associated protein